MKWNVDKYKHNADYVPILGQDLLNLLSPKPKEKILDIGCGNGELTKKISQFNCSVYAIDNSPQMVKAAKNNGINAQVLDAQKMNFNNKFNAVFSNAALHWMKNPNAVISNVYQALKTNGRFCAEFGAKNNIKTIVDAIYAQLQNLNLNGDNYNPWYFPDETEYRLKLEKNGFKVVEISVFERPTTLPTNLVGWLDTFATPFMQDIPTEKKSSFMQAIENTLASKLRNKNNNWIADYVRCRFLAKKV